MTEAGESIAVALPGSADDPECEYQPEDTSWSCQLDGSDEALAQNLGKQGMTRPAAAAGLDAVSSTHWPSLAHHLIPWQQLRKHPVTQWLAQSPPQGSGQLLADNDYSVDHGHNGRFIPDASALSEWAGADATLRRRLLEAVMQAAGISLQAQAGDYAPYGVGEDGYRTRVAEYLDRVNLAALDHVNVAQCPDCSKKNQDGKVPARRNVVELMDAVSAQLDVDVATGRVFVSAAGAPFVAAGEPG